MVVVLRGAAEGAVAAAEAFRSAPRPAAFCAPGSVRSEVLAAWSAARSGGSSDPDVGPPCPAALGVAAAACSPARFCLIEADTSRLSGLPSTTVAIAPRRPQTTPTVRCWSTNGLTPTSVGSARDAPTLVGPSWPSNLRPTARHLHYPADVDAPHSLYVDKGQPELGLGEIDDRQSLSPTHLRPNGIRSAAFGRSPTPIA